MDMFATFLYFCSRLCFTKTLLANLLFNLFLLVPNEYTQYVGGRAPKKLYCVSNFQFQSQVTDTKLFNNVLT